MPLPLVGQVGPQVLADGASEPFRQGRSAEVIVQELHGQYYEQAVRGNVFFAANQAATAWSVALATTYTGLVISNPIGSGKNLAILKAGFVLTVAPAAIASIGYIGGYATTGLTAHTTPLIPLSTFLNTDVATGIAKADAAATLPGTARWLMPFMGGFTAAALPSTGPAMVESKSVWIVPPGGYFGIGALTAVTGMASIIWEEVAI